jgi:hypothetical protein
MLGEHVPGQGHGVAGVTHIGRELAGRQQPEAAVMQRGQAALRGQTGHHVASHYSVPWPAGLSPRAAGGLTG